MVSEHLGHSVSGHIQMFWGTWSVLADFGIWGYLGGGEGGGLLRAVWVSQSVFGSSGGAKGGWGHSGWLRVFWGYQSTRGTLGQFCSIFGNI